MLKAAWPRSVWEAKLRELGCEPVEGTPKRRTGEFWHYPRHREYPFFAAYDDDEMMDAWVLIRLVKDIKGEASH